ncbi:hypothetical protein KUCAC02_006307 [Chaenocephalus aceratus]|uniref:Uncharacterized protein n=1 Tax=Chaenocephalus aceratus TaxID=36190 RepID=A0ACB9VRN8_CHAAC|nr:hypothetical protein KUCAC02_006307 [Chaenocephalus aceratus]
MYQTKTLSQMEQHVPAKTLSQMEQHVPAKTLSQMEQHVPGQDPESDGADNNLNTLIEEESVAEDAKQTRPHHEEDTDDDDDDDVIIDPNYNPSSEESLKMKTVWQQLQNIMVLI